MSKFDKLNEVFETEDEPIDIGETTVISKEERLAKIESSVEDIHKDYEYTRGNLYSIIEKGQEALNGILELAQESEMPRAYEVAGQLIKNVADATDKLMALQKNLKDVTKEDDKGPTNVTNALFVGSTADLQKMLKSMNKSTDNK